MAQSFSRNIQFEGILNFRDLGGYSTLSGRLVKRRWIFRSGELRFMTDNDFYKLKNEVGIKSILDLTNEITEQNPADITRLVNGGIRVYSAQFSTGQTHNKEGEEYQNFTNMGEAYLWRIGYQQYSKRIIEALEILADPANYPLLFHCAAGKDRTGILAAIMLGLLNVVDDDIVTDYILSATSMLELRKRWKPDSLMGGMVKDLPEYTWGAEPDSMYLFLAGLRQKYGSISEYVKSSGASANLIERLQNTLLV